LKIHFHISSLGQIVDWAPRNFPLIAGVLLPFSSLALFAILHVGLERGAQPLLCAEIAAADNTPVKQSPARAFGRKNFCEGILLLYGVASAMLPHVKYKYI
jgi:hypothetical protein